MAPLITGLDDVRVEVADGVQLEASVGGSGPPLVLLHGFPQTRLMWRRVVERLVGEHTLVCPDLRGYGGSSKPAEAGASTYAKRTMAADVLALAAALGHERVSVVGHDRGALVAFRAALDSPAAVAHLVCLDVVPTVDTWELLHGASAAVAWHLYLMAQPPGLPEALVAGAPDAFFGSFLDAWVRDPAAIPEEVRAAYLAASRAAVPSIVADYRASAGGDHEHDLADRAAGRRLAMPVGVLQQDWGAALGYDAAAVWRAWAPDLEHRTTASGHFMAEESPDEVVRLVREVVRR